MKFHCKNEDLIIYGCGGYYEELVVVETPVVETPVVVGGYSDGYYGD
jgi:hypothetical protein